MIYLWCLGLTVWLSCTAWMLVSAWHKIYAIEGEIAELRMQVQVLRSRINYGKDVMPNMTGVTRTK